MLIHVILLLDQHPASVKEGMVVSVLFPTGFYGASIQSIERRLCHAPDSE